MHALRSGICVCGLCFGLHARAFAGRRRKGPGHGGGVCNKGWERGMQGGFVVGLQHTPAHACHAPANIWRGIVLSAGSMRPGMRLHLTWVLSVCKPETLNPKP